MIVGSDATLADFSVFETRVRAVGITPSVARLPALMTGACCQFFGNRGFTFRAQAGSLSRQARLFLLAEAFTLGLNWSTFHLLVTHVEGVPPEFLSFLGTFVVFVVMTVITTVLGALPKLRRLQGRMEALSSDFDIEKYERLERHALALQQAHAVYQTTRARHPSLAPLAHELVKVRDNLLGNALSLARYGLIDRQPLQAIQRNAGYRPLARDIGLLVAVYRERWGSLIGKTPVTSAELDRASALALQLLGAVGAREHTPPAFARAARIHQQAFTLLVEAYADVRHDLRYLLGKKGEVEAVAPSLYAGRGRAQSARHPAEARGTAPRRVAVAEPLGAKIRHTGWAWAGSRGPRATTWSITITSGDLSGESSVWPSSRAAEPWRRRWHGTDRAGASPRSGAGNAVAVVGAVRDRLGRAHIWFHGGGTRRPRRSVRRRSGHHARGVAPPRWVGSTGDRCVMLLRRPSAAVLGVLGGTA